MARFTVLLRLLTGEDGRLHGQLTDLASGRQLRFADAQALWQALLVLSGVTGSPPPAEARPDQDESGACHGTAP